MPWLDRLDSNNSQGEYYLTDVIAMAVADGVPVHGVKAADWKEVMGINDRKHAEAERALQQRRVDELMEQGVSFADKYRTVIGDGVFIGSGVELVAPVEVGAGATIGAGSTITKAAPGEELTLAQARQVTIEGWKRPVEKPV